MHGHGLLNPLNAELNPICHLLALLGAHLIFYISSIGVEFYRPRGVNTTQHFVTKSNLFKDCISITEVIERAVSEEDVVHENFRSRKPPVRTPIVTELPLM